MITKRLFGQYNGTDIYAYTLSGGIRAEICTLGATVLSLCVHNPCGEFVDVVLGMLTPSDVVEKATTWAALSAGAATESKAANLR